MTLSGPLAVLAAAVLAMVPAAAPQALCTSLTLEALGQITSRSYTETNSQVDTAALKHCEYRGGANVVSIMLAVGPDARSRFDTAAKMPGVQPVAGIGDQANWEPVRGKLAVLRSGQSVEVTVNAPHGAAAARQKMAVEVARRVLGL